MECNRDEAHRAKSIAESKLEKKDLTGAKKFALKAQNLYPKLDGISQFLTTIDVYACAENKIGGEVDWYTVLSVNPSANDETIKKQFRKLALMLHPDKNKSVGANDAFELISEAWSLLSDKSKRFAYDRRRGCKVFQQNVSPPVGGPPAPSPANRFHNFTNRATSVPKTQNHSTVNVSPMKSAPARCSKTNDSFWTARCSKTNDSFWTKCNKCKMHYEHVRKYLNCTLLCPNCKEAFLASETDPPANIENDTVKVPLKSKHAPFVKRSDSFWTVCNQCKVHYEHRRMYLNCTLLCLICKKPFLASETAPPPIKSKKNRKRWN